MKVVVVGAGITGCISALNLLKRGHEVSIYDSSGSIGGVLQDITINQDNYFRGCQYLNSCSTWFSEIRDELTCNYQEFEHTYSSYTSIFSEKIVHDDFVGPVVNQTIEGFDSEEKISDSLETRLSHYPKSIKAGLLPWLNRFSHNLNNLHQNCVHGVQLSRIYFNYDDADLIEQKKKSCIADNLIGIPRSIINPNIPYPKTSLPAKGFNHFFKSLKEYLVSCGAQFSFNSPITPKRESNGDIRFFCREQSVESDLILWTGNPVPIIYAAGLGKLDNPVCKMILYVCDLDDQSILVSPHYIQVYSQDTVITRIFTYTIGRINRATIECFYDTDITPQEVVADANKILIDSGFNIKLLVEGSILQRRYIFYTIEDYKKIEMFEKYASQTNIIGGGWHIFGRDAKIEAIANNIAARLI